MTCREGAEEIISDLMFLPLPISIRGQMVKKAGNTYDIISQSQLSSKAEGDIETGESVEAKKEYSVSVFHPKAFFIIPPCFLSFTILVTT